MSKWPTIFDFQDVWFHFMNGFCSLHGQFCVLFQERFLRFTLVTVSCFSSRKVSCFISRTVLRFTSEIVSCFFFFGSLFVRLFGQEDLSLPLCTDVVTRAESPFLAPAVGRTWAVVVGCFIVEAVSLSAQ